MSITLTRLYSDTHHYDAGTVQINIPFVGNTLAVELTTKPEYATTEQKIGTLFQFSGTAQKAYDLYSGKDIVKLELPETDRLWFSPTSYLSDNYVLTIDYTNVGSVINGSNTVSVPEQILGLPARVTALESIPVVSTIQCDSVTGKPLLFMPSQHNHVISEVTGLTSALTGYNLSIQNIEVRLSAVELALIPPAPIAVLWTPLAITTQLWLDASDIASVTVISGGVSQWSDKSGYNRNATQSNPANRPLYTNTLNGKNVISFDGSSSWFDNIAAYTGQFFSAVAQTNQAKSYAGFHTGSGSELILDGSGMAVIAASPFVSINAVPTKSIAVNIPFIWDLALNSPINTPRTLGQEFNLGGSSRAWNGFGAELISLSATPSIDIQQRLRGYLAHRWGLTANLPSDHPYKTNPPYV